MEYLYTHYYHSPAGGLYLAVDRQGVVYRVEFRDFRRDLPPGTWEDNKYACGEVEFQLDEYFSGRRRLFSLNVALPGTGFQQAVWHALRRINYGDTMTYGEVARKIGRRDAARAVGNAVGRNPVAVIVPCHRVVPASGDTGHYARQTLSPETGRRVKAHLLSIERGELRPGFGRDTSFFRSRLAAIAPGNTTADT